mmetsp:Transcript_23085/g.54560  ORF Transcript_23085/g.54560 Transcript_23085/m.54560 type:complete len:109 (-) Transcript_23085:338-664(-)
MATFQQEPQTSPVGRLASFDPETSPIPDQQAWAILDLHGTLVRSSADNNANDLPPIVRDAKILYGMLVESTPLVSHEGLKRMTINFASLRYVIARDDHHIYLIQTKGE